MSQASGEREAGPLLLLCWPVLVLVRPGPGTGRRRIYVLRYFVSAALCTMALLTQVLLSHSRCGSRIGPLVSTMPNLKHEVDGAPILAGPQMTIRFAGAWSAELQFDCPYLV